jgi:hypothetical protein
MTIQTLYAIQQRILNTAAQVNIFHTSGFWQPEFCFDQLAEALGSKEPQYFKKITVTIEELKKLNLQELYSFGFGKWDGNMVLIPLWIVNFIEGDPELIHITGTTHKLSEYELYNRNGITSFGFYLE